MPWQRHCSWPMLKYSKYWDPDFTWRYVQEFISDGGCELFDGCPKLHWS